MLPQRFGDVIGTLQEFPGSLLAQIKPPPCYSCVNKQPIARRKGGRLEPPGLPVTKRLLLVFLTALLFTKLNASGSSRLAIRVSPTLTFAPAQLKVHTTVEPNEENRRLSIEVDSPAYQRASEIQLDGSSSQRTSIFELRDVPAGLYEVRAVLTGSRGPIARTMQLVKVEAAAGRR
jgi:hypothetical protein